MSCLFNHYGRCVGKRRGRLLALPLAFALVLPVFHAEDWDHLNGGDKVQGPTGQWLLRIPHTERLRTT
jgi:hypothetical protein